MINFEIKFDHYIYDYERFCYKIRCENERDVKAYCHSELIIYIMCVHVHVHVHVFSTCSLVAWMAISSFLVQTNNVHGK